MTTRYFLKTPHLTILRLACLMNIKVLTIVLLLVEIVQSYLQFDRFFIVKLAISEKAFITFAKKLTNE